MSEHAFRIRPEDTTRVLTAFGVAALLALAPASGAGQTAQDDVIVESITYGSDGIELGGILARPAQFEGRAPGILALHGGGNSGLQRAMEWLVVRLARRGYVALSGTYRPPTMERDDLADSRMGVDYLTSLPYVDPTKIGMTGQSRGAGNTYRLGAADDRVGSLIPIAGTSAAVVGLPDQGGGDRRMLSEQRWMEGIRGAGGFPHELPAEEEDDRRPRPDILAMDKPVLIIQGTWDLHAPAEGAIAVKAEVERRGAEHVKVNLVPGMGHFFDAPRGVLMDEIGELAADWYDETLRGVDTGRDFEKPLELPPAPVWPAGLEASVREITYRAGGATVPGYLIEPASRNGRGVVYAPDGHSGAEATRLGFVLEALTKQGNVVLVTRFRSAVGDVTDDEDIAGALDRLAAVDGVDRAITVVGHGRGGMAALRSAAKDDRVAAVVAMGAAANLTRLIQGLEAYSPASARFQASRFADPSTYPALSPHYYARDIRVPVLLVHGSLDLMVAPEHMLWNAVGLMTTGNTEVELYMVPWDIHHFDSSFAWLKPEQWVGRITDFLDRSVASSMTGATDSPGGP